MIIGISGTICSGKFSFVQFLVQTYQFEAVNLQHIFKNRLRQKLLQQKLNKKLDSSDNSVDDTQQAAGDDEPDLSDDSFCFAYYQSKSPPQF